MKPKVFRRAPCSFVEGTKSGAQSCPPPKIRCCLELPAGTTLTRKVLRTSTPQQCGTVTYISWMFASVQQQKNLLKRYTTKSSLTHIGACKRQNCKELFQSEFLLSGVCAALQEPNEISKLHVDSTELVFSHLCFPEALSCWIFSETFCHHNKTEKCHLLHLFIESLVYHTSLRFLLFLETQPFGLSLFRFIAFLRSEWQTNPKSMFLSFASHNLL